MTGIIRMQKDVLKDSQRQLTDARQTTAKVDEQLRQARREMQLMRNKQAAELRVAGISPAAECVELLHAHPGTSTSKPGSMTMIVVSPGWQEKRR